MSAREWKPGDVAMVRRGSADWHRAIWTEDMSAPGWHCIHGPCSEVSDVHPLIVLDPDDHAALDPIIDLIWGDRDPSNRPATWQIREALKARLVEPPKPPEPTGRYSVVEDDNAVEWVRAELIGTHQWHSIEGVASRWADWPDITAVRVLSEGVCPGEKFLEQAQRDIANRLDRIEKNSPKKPGEAVGAALRLDLGDPDLAYSRGVIDGGDA